MNNNSYISKGELVSTLTDIDSKINDLYSRSNSDFMQLNEYLKDYHKKTRIISENAFRILETITGGKDMDLIKELKTIQGRIDSYRSNISTAYTQKLRTLKEIGYKTNQLNIVLRNLRQDFSTLRFLSTNYSLISTYNDLASEFSTDQEFWNSEVNSIHQLLIFFNDQVDNFREKVSEVIREVGGRTENSFELFRSLSAETDQNIDIINLKNHESKLQFPVLKEKTSDTSRSISDIITHLQYQDIIRQKIEHIRNSHYGIIDNLNQVGETSSGRCSQDDYQKIGDIIDLQSAQLLLVSKEYQNALNVITRNFQGIAKDMSIVSGISDRFSFESSNSKTNLLSQIRCQLDEGIIRIDLNNEITINQDYDKISGMLAEIISKADEYVKPQITGFSAENKIVSKFRFNEAASGVFSQMIALTRDIEVKSNEIKDYLDDLKNLASEICKNNDGQHEESDYEIDRLQLMVRITKILDSLDRDNVELDKVLIQNRELNTNILQKIEIAVNKSDYCEYFENTVGEIISQLSEINYRIKPSLSGNYETRAVNLEKISNNYTMESERKVHDMVVKKDDEKIDSTLNTPDNEIEFF